jgi:hypothetical protein
MTPTAEPREFAMYRDRDVVAAQISQIEREVLAGPFDPHASRKLDLLTGLHEALVRDIDHAEDGLRLQLAA